MKARSVSEILDFQTCPALHAYKHRAKRRPRRQAPSKALALGNTIHSLLEHFSPANPLCMRWDHWVITGDLKLREYMEGATEEALAEAREELEHLLYFVFGWATSAQTRWNSVARELVLEHDGAKGKIDSLERDPVTKGLMHRQYKVSSQDPEGKAKAQEMSMHEGIYAHLIGKHYPEERYLGTELVVFRRVSRFARQAGAEAEGRKGYRLKEWTEGVNVHRLPVDAWLSDRARLSFNHWSGRIDWAGLFTWTQEGPFPIHTDACFRWGRLCEYASVCGGQSKLSDEVLFEDFDPEARYAEEGSE